MPVTNELQYSLGKNAFGKDYECNEKSLRFVMCRHFGTAVDVGQNMSWLKVHRSFVGFASPAKLQLAAG
jgi:hypothetical protein